MHALHETAAPVLKTVIVEDSLAMQAALQELVEAVGTLRVVATESTAATAIHWASSHPQGWDIAVVDLMLAEGNGFEVISRLSSQSERGRIIVFSAFVTPVIDSYCRQLGADAVFRKEDTALMASYMEHLQ